MLIINSTSIQLHIMEPNKHHIVNINSSSLTNPEKVIKYIEEHNQSIDRLI